MGRLYWITGLAGAGKTTIARQLYDYLRHNNPALVLLDGDELREVFKNKCYTMHERRKLAYKYSDLAYVLTSQGIDVIIATIAMFDEIREYNREKFADYVEIFIDTDIETLIKRDKNKLYSRALNGEIPDVMGINAKAELPKTPDIVLKFSESETKEQHFFKLLNLMNKSENLVKKISNN